MQIKEIQDLWSNEWLIMKNAKYIDKNGKLKDWQYVERTGNRKVVTIVCQNNVGSILLIREVRIPINAIENSFPAGLVDEGENLEQAALMELKEETGYEAKVLSIGSLNPKSAGLTSEEASLVYCITSDKMAGTTTLEETENIEPFWINPTEFFEYIKKLNTKEIKIAHDLYCFMTGYNLKLQIKKNVKRKKNKIN